MRKIVFAVLFFCSALYSQNLDLAISYLFGERSKDSHTTEENIAIGGTRVAYSIEYRGHKGDNQNDETKSCDFTTKNIEDLRNFIIEKGLNKSDSLIGESTKHKSFETFVRISISMAMDGSDYKIKINGDTDEIGRKDLYKNTTALVDKIRQMVKECK
jgi:hypothetical protein